MAVKKAKNSKASKKKTLVIVESPSKAKTLTKLLGRGYEVKASVGHVRDLPKSRLAVDIENNFKPDYIVVRGKGQVVKELKKKASESSRIILASDPDREGEAIAWHLAEILGISAESPCRMRMYEITPKGVKEALGGLGPIDMNKVYAQQARRIMDRLVGYSISPILWRKIKWGLSAGRVQSAALKIVCDRERAIEDFVPQEYWNISVEAQKENGALYNLRVEKRGGKTLLKDGKTLLIDSEKVADEIIEVIVSNPLVVKDFTSKEGERKPPAPFKTSTLQQEAARRLKFSPRKTMSIAQ
ncbi:MAG TPA: DNA topoisomerase I, partial [Thermovirga lienii]|nr:DNA topoisomerase I [Thermovirga lienii]